MLYPIELLRHKLPARIHRAIDGVHVNGHARLCHVIHRLFKCRHIDLRAREELPSKPEGTSPLVTQKKTAVRYVSKALNPALMKKSPTPFLNDLDHIPCSSKSAICHYPIKGKAQ